MGKQFNDAPRGGSFQRGGGQRGGRGGFRPGGNRFQQGPPSYVIPYGTFLHKSQSTFVVKCTDMGRFPKFNRGVFLENKAKVGTVDEILGPLNGFFFSVKPAEGVDPKSFKEGQVLYMNPEDLLSTDRFTRPQAPRPRGAPGQGGAGGFRGRPQQRGGSFSRGGAGGFNNRGGSGGFRGGDRPSFNNRGGARR